MKAIKLSKRQRIILYWLAFALLLSSFLAYGLTFIDQHSFVIEGERYFTLFDDAMISMRYAHNLAEGHGLVWNAGGERVEGFSNPLWVLVMALAHMITIPYPHTSLAIKLLALLLMASNLFAVRKLASLFTDNPFFQLLTVFFTAFYFPVNNWALLGMEVSLIVLLVNLALISAIQDLQHNKASRRPYVLLGVATLVRVDAAVILVALALGLMLVDRPRLRFHLQWAALSLAIFVGGQTLFRLIYYGELLPTTAVLKLSGISTVLRASLGLRAFLDFMVLFNWALFLLPFIAVLFQRKRGAGILLLVIFMQVVYSIYVGGDSWEHIGGANRFIASVMPLFFISFVLSLETISKKFQDRFSLTGFRELGLGLVVVAFSVGALVNFNDMRLADGHLRWTLQKKLPLREGAERFTRVAITLDRFTQPDAKIAVVAAGAIPYYSDLSSIDLLGKNDPLVAAGTMRINSSLFHIDNFRPGHNKWDYEYSIGQLKPDVIAQLWEDTEKDFEPFADLYTLYYINDLPFYIHNDSVLITRDALPEPHTNQ